MARRSSVGWLYIVRLRPATDPVSASYLLTFGSLNLGSVHGLDGLTDVLRAGRVPVHEIEKAWRVLAVELRHQIPNVTLGHALIRLLNF